MGNIQLVRQIAKEKLEEYWFAAHDYLHVERVAESGLKICEGENGDFSIVEPAAWLHDIGYKEEILNGKNHAIVSGELAKPILIEAKYDREQIKKIIYAIKSHSYSDGIVPKTLEAKILQDADRLDVIGVIGLVRIFEYGGAKKRMSYNPESFFGKNGRELDDKKYTVDHFLTKMCRLGENMHTKTAREFAKIRTERMYDCLEWLESEVKGLS